MFWQLQKWWRSSWSPPLTLARRAHSFATTVATQKRMSQTWNKLRPAGVDKGHSWVRPKPRHICPQKATVLQLLGNGLGSSCFVFPPRKTEKSGWNCEKEGRSRSRHRRLLGFVRWIDWNKIQLMIGIIIIITIYFIINYDKYASFKKIFKQGTPYVQIIPFKREPWKLQINKGIVPHLNHRVNYFTKLYNRYKTLIWNKKKWS